MAFLFSHTQTTPSSLSRSLLCHHRHLSSTTTSVSYVLCKKQFQVLTLTTPSPSLLPHHRLLATSNFNSGAGDVPNSNHPSPSLLRELCHAIKKLSVREYIFVTPFTDQFSFLPPFNSNPISYTFSPPPPPDQNSNLTSSSTLDEKLQHLTVSALSLQQKQDTDHQRLSQLMESKRAFCAETMEIMAEVVKSYQTTGLSVNHIDTSISKMTRLNEMSVEIMEFLAEGTNSRLACLFEIEENLYEIREDLQDDEVWNELNEGLMRRKEIEMEDFEVLAKETNIEIAYFQQRITNMFKIRENLA